MSSWVGDLLIEWRQRLATLAEPDRAPSSGETDLDRPTHALELLRIHVKRAGVLLRLTEVRAPAPSSDPTTQSGNTGAAHEPHDAGAGGGSRFGRRRSSRYEEDPALRFLRPPREVLRMPARTGHGSEAESGSGPAAITRQRDVPGPGNMKLADTAFRESGKGEEEMLRDEVKRLKETLADLLVENRQLKKRLELESNAQAAS